VSTISSRTRLLVNSAGRDYTAIYCHGTETLSGDFSFEVWVDSDDLSAEMHGLGDSVTLTFVANDGLSRSLSGVLLALTDKGIVSAPNDSANQRRRFVLTLGSRLSLLSNLTHSRVFTHINIKDLLSYLLTDAGYHPSQLDWRLSQSLPDKVHFIQALESHGDLFYRLIRQYGLLYWFEDDNIVISDNNLHSPYLPRGFIETHHSLGFASDGSPACSADYSQKVNRGFVGFSQCKQGVRQRFGGVSALYHSHPPGVQDEISSVNLAQPVASTAALAFAFSTQEAQALNTFSERVSLTGNVSDCFAGCSFTLQTASTNNTVQQQINGEYLAYQVEHYCVQPSAEHTQDGLSRYYCKVQAIPRGTAFKLPMSIVDNPYHAQYTPYLDNHYANTNAEPLPQVFPAKVVTLSGHTANEQGDYHVRLDFDKQARGEHEAPSAAIKQLVFYACSEQKQATGWHFPLRNNSEVFIGCLNGDINQTYLLGVSCSTDQPSVGNAYLHSKNTLRTQSGNEVCFEDKTAQASIVLQTLDSEQYFELFVGSTPHYIQWLSRYGAISLHAGKDLLVESTNNDISFVVQQGQLIDVKKHYRVQSQHGSLQFQAGTHARLSAPNTTLTSKQNITAVSEKNITLNAQTNLAIETAQGDFLVSVPKGSTIIEANGDINIIGSGQGELIVHNNGAEIKLANNGDVSLTATEVLTFNAQGKVSFNGDVNYNLTSPEVASAPEIAKPKPVPCVNGLNLFNDPDVNTQQHTINLNYVYQDNTAVQHAPYTLTLSDGTELTGTLDAQGQATIEQMPAGQYTVQLGEDTRDYVVEDNTTKNPLFGKITPEKAVKMVETGDTSLLTQAGDMAAGAGDWLWGTLQGDFNENPSTSQVVIGTVISMIPVVDQLMDCRDVCANALLLTDENEDNDTAGWIALTLTGIGFVPFFGSAVKGVGKVIIKNSRESLSAALAILRKLGKGDPIKFLEKLDWRSLSKQATELITEKVLAIKQALDAITNSTVLRWSLADDTLKRLNTVSEQLTNLIPNIEKGIKRGINTLEEKFNQALQHYKGEVPHTGNTGVPHKVKADELTPPKGNELKGAKGKKIAKPMDKYTPPCFTPGAELAKNVKGNSKALEKEFYKQLKAQQNGINKMTVGQYLNNRKTLTELTEKYGHKKARQILTKGGAEQTKARIKLENEILESVEKSLRKKGIRGKKAEDLAQQKVKEQMAQLAALHDPDLIAGGNDTISKLGNKGVNSSLGSQWAKSGRVAGMDDVANHAFKTQGANARMNINLERCR